MRKLKLTQYGHTISTDNTSLEELELMLDIHLEIIADFEIVTGKELAKKFLPKPLADAGEKIKQERLKSK